MEILELIEKDDGSAKIIANFTEEEIKFFVSYAVNDILKKYLEEENVRRCNEGNKED
jgi:hypothetical protein